MPDAITANSMVDASQRCRAAGVTLSQVSLNLLGCTGATAAAAYSCTGGLILNAPSNTTNYASTFPNVNRNDNGIAKIDYAINSKHRISGMLWTGYYAAFGQDHPTVNPLFGIRNFYPLVVDRRELDLDPQFHRGERIPVWLRPAYPGIYHRRPGHHPRRLGRSVHRYRLWRQGLSPQYGRNERGWVAEYHD